MDKPYMHVFHFVMDRGMKKDLKKLDMYEETGSLSGVIMKIFLLLAPLIKKEFSNVYMFILVTNSEAKNTMNSKFLVPKLRELNAFALKICIANKQDSPKALNHETVGNILDIRTYPLIATDSKSYEQFMKIIWETILIRIEQMREHSCPYI